MVSDRKRYKNMKQQHETPRLLFHLGKIVVYLDIFIAFVDVLWPLLFTFLWTFMCHLMALICHYLR